MLDRVIQTYGDAAFGHHAPGQHSRDQRILRHWPGVDGLGSVGIRIGGRPSSPRWHAATPRIEIDRRAENCHSDRAIVAKRQTLDPSIIAR